VEFWGSRLVAPRRSRRSTRAETDGNENLALEQLALACTALASVIEIDSLEAWNDDVARIFEDVLDALGQAATHTA
jgi:hypothetical protein